MKKRNISGHQLSGIHIITHINEYLKSDYYALLEKFPECMWVFVDQSMPVNHNNKPTI